ncbi:MAG: hypothetical protein DRO12_04025 [Thermoprotei archaeon]|nr:MAG: hypothetical protein DRO12_04025 [Thermoprotei archaeon]
MLTKFIVCTGLKVSRQCFTIHIMDYVCSLLMKLKYGALVKHIIKEIRRAGFATLYEDVDTGQVYTSPSARGLLRTVSLRREEAMEFVFRKVRDMVNSILNLINRDFSKQRDNVEKLLHSLSRDMKKCIEESTRKLVYTYITSLLNGSSEKCSLVFKVQRQMYFNRYL